MKMKNEWVVCAFEDFLSIASFKDKKFESLSEAIKYAREEVLEEKNPAQVLNQDFQNNEDFEIDFLSLAKAKKVAQIIRADRYYNGHLMAIEASNNPEIILKNLA